MNYWKELEIERIENPFMDIPEQNVGLSLFENKLLKEYIAQNGQPGMCDFSQKMDTVVTLRDLIIFIYDLLANYYGDIDNEGVGWDSSLEKDPTPGFHSECGGYVVPNHRSYYDDIATLLFENRFIVNDDRLFQVIVDNFPSIRWIEKDPYGLTESEERAIDWREIKHKSLGWSQDIIIRICLLLIELVFLTCLRPFNQYRR